MVLIAFTAKTAAAYATVAAISALLQQVNGERSLIQPVTAIPKKHITATFSEIDLTGNGIIS
jgi:ABC-type branched-subunit amino acid transport system substrate-binding protein